MLRDTRRRRRIGGCGWPSGTDCPLSPNHHHASSITSALRSLVPVPLVPVATSSSSAASAAASSRVGISVTRSSHSSSSSSSSSSHGPTQLRSMTYHDVENLQVILLPAATSSNSTAESSQLLFLTSYSDTIPYCSDWTHQYSFPHPLSQRPGTSSEREDLSYPTVCVAQPRTVRQVAQIVTYCFQHGIPIVPLGGRTGLVGGTIPRYTTTTTTTPTTDTDSNAQHTENNDSILDQQQQQQQHPLELLLSTKYLRDNESDRTQLRMTNRTGILQCGVGYTLQEVQEYARRTDRRDPDDGSSSSSPTSSSSYTVPIDIGSKGTCTMGGIVATNAGGQYYYRYQSLMANVIGLQCVTGTGAIMSWNYSKYGNSSSNNCVNYPPNSDPAVSEPHIAANFKDNTGYKLYPLLIGSEGTLGIITGITLKCTPYLPNKQTMIVTISLNPNQHTVDSDDHHRNNNQKIMMHMLQIVQAAQRIFGEILAAVEWMDPNIIHVIAKSLDDETKTTKLHNVLAFAETVSNSSTPTWNDNRHETAMYPHCILIETHGTIPQHDEEKCYNFLNTLLGMNGSTKTTGGTSSNNECCSSHHNTAAPFVVDVKMAKSDTDSNYFWSIRESANPSVTKLGYTYKYDVSIPNSYFHLLIQPIRERIYEKYTTDRIRITSWGHILDGNLHLNITDVGNHQRDADVVSTLEPFLYEEVMRLGGSISAEHGIGQMKVQYMEQIHDPMTRQMMHSIKQVFDPAGIMNPGKVLPTPPEST